MVILTEKAKKILKSNKLEEEKDNFYLQFVSKITDKVTQRIKGKKKNRSFVKISIVIM